MLTHYGANNVNSRSAVNVDAQIFVDDFSSSFRVFLLLGEKEKLSKFGRRNKNSHFQNESHRLYLGWYLYNTKRELVT